MSHRTHPRRVRTALATAAAAVLLGGLTLASPASAAPQDFFLAFTSGNVTVGDGSFELPDGGGFNGTWDDETGALAGEFVIPTIVSEVEDIPGAVVTATFVQQGAATGSIDPDTGVAAISPTLRLNISVSIGEGTPPLTDPDCHVAPITLDLTGAYDADAETLDLAANGFTIPPSQGCGALGGTIDDFISGDPTEAVLSLVRVDSPIGVEPPPPPPPPADDGDDGDDGDETGAAPPAQPITGEAQFTG